VSVPASRRAGTQRVRSDARASVRSRRKGQVHELRSHDRSIERESPHPVAEDPSMAWSTYLFSALLAMTTPTHAAPPRHWTVIVGGATADTSIYANAFFPQTIEVGVGDTVTWTFEGFHNVAFLSGGAAPSFGVPEGDKTYWNPQVLFPAGGRSYDGTGYHTSGLPGPDGRLSYTLTFTKPGRYPYMCTIHPRMSGMVIVTDKATGTPAAALKRGRAEQAATLAAGRARFAGLEAERNGASFVVPLVGNSQQRY